MTGADLHLAEVTSARALAASAIDELRRLLWIQSAAGLIVTLLLYSHFIHVRAVDAELWQIERVLEAESQATVLSFVINHAEQDGYTVRPDGQARSVQQLLTGGLRVNGLETSDVALGKYTLGEVHRLALQRPDTIRMTLPYVDKVELPLSYPVLALAAAILSLVGNLFVLMRQRSIGDIETYADRHLEAAVNCVRTGSEDDFVAFARPRSSEPWSGRRPAIASRVLQVLSGLLDERLADRTATLIELGAGVISAVVVVCLFTMATYLVIEKYALRWQTALLPLSIASGLLLTVVASGLAAVLIRWIFGETRPE